MPLRSPLHHAVWAWVTAAAMVAAALAGNVRAGAQVSVEDVERAFRVCARARRRPCKPCWRSKRRRWPMLVRKVSIQKTL